MTDDFIARPPSILDGLLSASACADDRAATNSTSHRLAHDDRHAMCKAARSQEGINAIGGPAVRTLY